MHSGLTEVVNSDYAAVHNILNDSEGYGIDGDGPSPDTDADDEVEVPESAINLNAALLHHLQASIDPLSNDGNHGVTLYLCVLRIVEGLLSG